MNNEITIDGVVYVRKDKCSCPFMNKVMTFEQFLRSEREPKFKPGDIIVGLRVSGSGYGINIVLEVRDGFYVLKYRPIMNDGEWADDEARICEIDQKCTKVGVVDDVMNVEDYILNTTDKAIIISNGHVCR